MANDNKIISFDSIQKKRRKPEYKLKAEISVNLCKNGESYINNWYSKDEKITEEEIYLILKSIFYELGKKIHEITIKKDESYNVDFTLLYYENVNKKLLFPHYYLLVPSPISFEMYVMVSMQNTYVWIAPENRSKYT